MISAVFAVVFGLSLLPGRKPLCLFFAERISGGIMPVGAERYCRRLTWVWFAVLSLAAVVGIGGIGASFGFWTLPPDLSWLRALGWFGLFIVPLVFAVELPIRRRRFQAVFHTSGSTGKSKTIVKPFETLAREVAMHRDFYRGRFADCGGITFLGTVDIAHMLGKLWIDMLPHALGAKVDKSAILSPEELVAKMSAADKVFLVTTPSFLDRFTAYAGQYDVPRNCVEIVTSGAALPRRVSDRALAVFGVRPRQIFGSTETGGVASMREDEVARVFEGVAVKLVEGRLAVRSPFSFRRGWYVMGDGAVLSEDRRTFRLLGRLDRLVKINEERVNLAEMEEKVRALGYADAACVALDGTHGPYLGLVLVGGEQMGNLELRQRFATVFPRGAVPKKFRFAAELPRNTQGKVVKDEIAKMFQV